MIIYKQGTIDIVVLSRYSITPLESLTAITSLTMMLNHVASKMVYLHLTQLANAFYNRKTGGCDVTLESGMRAYATVLTLSCLITG